MDELQLAQLRLRALEIAEKTVHQPYISGGTQNGFDIYRDKDDKEILRRARDFMSFALGQTYTETEATLIQKLRGMLCEKSAT